MGLFGPSDLERSLHDDILALRKDIAELKIQREALASEADAQERVNELEREITKLTIERDQIVEENDRQERETRHEVGLLRKQIEVEQELATQEAILKVREENLTADRSRFEEQMKFTTERFEKETVYLREIMGEIMKRLPTVEVNKRILEGVGANGNGANHDGE